MRSDTSAWIGSGDALTSPDFQGPDWLRRDADRDFFIAAGGHSPQSMTVAQDAHNYMVLIVLLLISVAQGERWICRGPK